jgi:hypothetical protein
MITKKGDVFSVETVINTKNVNSILSLNMETIGENAENFYQKEFSVSFDGGLNWTKKIDESLFLTQIALSNIFVVYPKNNLKIKIYFEHINLSADLNYELEYINFSFETTLYDSVMADFIKQKFKNFKIFDVFVANNLLWEYQNNILKKLYFEGVLPKYIERNIDTDNEIAIINEIQKTGAKIITEVDFTTFFSSVCLYFSLLYVRITKFNELADLVCKQLMTDFCKQQNFTIDQNVIYHNEAVELITNFLNYNFHKNRNNFDDEQVFNEPKALLQNPNLKLLKLYKHNTNFIVNKQSVCYKNKIDNRFYDLRKPEFVMSASGYKNVDSVNQTTEFGFLNLSSTIIDALFLFNRNKILNNGKYNYFFSFEYNDLSGTLANRQISLKIQLELFDAFGTFLGFCNSAKTNLAFVNNSVFTFTQNNLGLANNTNYKFIVPIYNKLKTVSADVNEDKYAKLKYAETYSPKLISTVNEECFLGVKFLISKAIATSGTFLIKNFTFGILSNRNFVFLDSSGVNLVIGKNNGNAEERFLDQKLNEMLDFNKTLFIYD